MIRLDSRYRHGVETGVATLLIAYPGLMFAVKGGMNGSFLFLLLLSMAVWVYRPRDMAAIVWHKEMTFYLLAMMAMPTAIFLSQSYHQHYDGHPYDAASRFLLAVPVFMLLMRVHFMTVVAVQYGFPLATLVGCLMIKPIAYGRYGIVTLDLIHFGDFSLILGVMSLFSLNWNGRDPVFLRSLKVIGFIAGLYCSMVSGSRGGWLALPVFLLIFMYFKFGKLTLKTGMISVLTLIGVGAVAYTVSGEVHHRVDDVTKELTAYNQGNKDTSTGIRLQLFKAAADVFVQHPVFGVGTDGFAREMDPRLKTGKVSTMAADLGKGEVHNDLLSKAAAFGVFGVMALLAIYLVPLSAFYCAMGSQRTQVRQSGLLGLVFVSGFMVFGLTVEILNLTMASAFYSLTVAVLLAACYNIHHDEKTVVPHRI